MNDNEIVAQRYRELEAICERRWGWLQWLIVAFFGLVTIWLLVPARNAVQERVPIMLASNNCRQVIIALKNYAGDHDGKYPEGASSNEVFRKLFQAGLIDDERLFTAMFSPYVGDSSIGSPPEFRTALMAGENHWAMTRGLNDSTNGNAPLVFENPAVASWPPLWNADVAGKPLPGRSWKAKSGAWCMVVIGRNDGSVAGEKLTSTTGTRIPLAPTNGTKNLFEWAGPHEVLDVEK